MKNEKTKWMPVQASDIAIGGSYLAFGISALLIISDLVCHFVGRQIIRFKITFRCKLCSVGIAAETTGKEIQKQDTLNLMISSKQNLMRLELILQMR
jgi:hypothetical protein